MLEVAIGWEVYAQHGSALDLGWIGLAEFVPMFVLALPAGQVADRAPRRLVFAGSLLIGAGVGVGLALVSGSGTTAVAPYLALARAPRWRWERPPLDGLLYGVSPSLVYLLAAGACVVAAGLVMAMRPAAADDVAVRLADESGAPRADLHSVLEGLRFVRHTQILLGALVGAALITRHPIAGRAGRLLLTVVLLYGASIVIFASRAATRCRWRRWRSAGSSTSTA